MRAEYSQVNVIRLYIVFREVTNHRIGLVFQCCASLSLVYNVENYDFCDLITGNAVSLNASFY